MRVAFGLSADYAALDSGGKATLVGLFTVLNVADLPAVHPRLYLLVGFDQEPDDVGRHIPFEIHWNDPDGRRMRQCGHGTVHVASHATDGPARTTIALPVDGLQVGVHGPHAFTVEIPGQPPFEIPVYVGPLPKS
jgi:hypothetical protein